MKETQVAAVIFDCEYTAWEGSLARSWSNTNEDPEIIAIGAVKLCVEGEDLILGPEFDVLVRPTRRPRLSAYITQLTGIKQETLDENGLEFSSAMTEFCRFIGRCPRVCSNGDDWSVLERNCEINRLKNPLSKRMFLNLRPLLAKCLDLPRESDKLHSHRLGNPGPAGEFANHPRGTPHNALDDAKAVARQCCAIKGTRFVDELLFFDQPTQ